MRSTIWCFISCILPCGALDVIRIVHVNGRVDEFTGTIYAAEILKAHPKHILRKPTTKPISDDVEPNTAHHRPAIVVVPPDAQLQRGKIYFLIPVSDGGKKGHKSSSTKSSPSVSSDAAASTARRRKKEQQQNTGRNGNNNNHHGNNNNNNNSNSNNNNNNNDKEDDKYLSEILSEKVSSQRERRRGRVGVWRPHLESITEAATFYQ